MDKGDFLHYICDYVLMCYDRYKDAFREKAAVKMPYERNKAG